VVVVVAEPPEALPAPVLRSLVAASTQHRSSLFMHAVGLGSTSSQRNDARALKQVPWQLGSFDVVVMLDHRPGTTTKK
jgi:hypothetical protein